MKSLPETSLLDAFAKGEPASHFFFEYQGSRAVHPLLLVDTGIELWHEHVANDFVQDNAPLWDLATSLLAQRIETPIYSWAEWLRWKILVGSYRPPTWKKKTPYPYKGLLISALYFQEAKQLCEDGETERAWHLITLAHYYLGLNTQVSARGNASRAAQILHAARTEKIRVLVLDALKIIRERDSARSKEQAKDQVVQILRAKHEQLTKIESKLRENEKTVLHWIREFDTLIPDTTKGRGDGDIKNDVFMRIRNMLDNWCLEKGPYPDIAKAFSMFGTRSRISVPSQECQENTAIDAASKEEYDLRIVNFFEEGHVLTMSVKAEDTEVDT